MNPYIELNKLEVEDNLLKFEFRSSLDVFKKRRFFVEYSKKIEHPIESINTLPFAAIMAPICWATGANLLLPSLDADYIQSLEASSGYWKKCFPSRWPFSGRIMTQPVRQPRSSTSKYGMLFSSGLDSLASYIHHRDKKPELFTVIGADFPYAKRDFAAMCKAKLFDRFAKQEGVELTYIYTDASDILNVKKLERYSPNWFGAVQHGLMLTSLAAPVSHADLKTLFIASCSHKLDYGFPCGSEPEVVRHLQWSNTAVTDDLHEINRAQKIAGYLKGRSEFYPYLRVCWMQHREINCSKCEKCLRTICELLLNNLDPNQLNFKVTDETLPALKRRLAHQYHLFFRGNEGMINFWRAIQESIQLDSLQDIHGSKAFFSWFLEFEKIKRKSNKTLLSFLKPYFQLRDALSHWKSALLNKEILNQGAS